MEGKGEKRCFNHFTSTGFKPANVTKITFTFKDMLHTFTWTPKA